MPFDRKAQFAPLLALIAAMEDVRVASDANVDAFEKQQAVVQAAKDAYNKARAQVINFNDYSAEALAAFSSTTATYTAESAKIAELETAERKGIADFNALWTQGEVMYHQLTQNPGAVEQIPASQQSK